MLNCSSLVDYAKLTWLINICSSILGQPVCIDVASSVCEVLVPGVTRGEIDIGRELRGLKVEVGLRWN